MTPGVITCTSCGSEARAGNLFCPRCARPLLPEWSGGDADEEPNVAGLPEFTSAWDSVLPRLQEALYGEFVVSRELGRGGMAAVFLAHQLRLNRKVAIKVMAPTFMSELGLVDRFRDEATTVARLDHPNIISVFEVGAAAGLQYFVMQYVAGRSLERVIRQHRALSLDVTRAILFAVGSALAYAHRNQVIHRDVKPGNILLSLDGRVIVTDFGIAKMAESTVRTATGAVVGTPAYMSPEQCLGRQLTWSADQYSLGIVAYEMVTGVQPFVGSAYVVMHGHTDEPVPSILERQPQCPPDLARAVERMLAKNPADRFPSMGEALTALGASRAGIDDAVELAIGQLAIPLPDEEGIVLVHTPASPAPARGSSGARSEPPSHEPPVPQETFVASAPVTQADAPPRPSALRVALSARLGRTVAWCRNAWDRARDTTGTLLQRARMLVVAGAHRARGSRAAIWASAATLAIAVVATVASLVPRDVRPKTVILPPPVVPETALGVRAAPIRSAQDSLAALGVDSLPDSVGVDTLASVDSAAAATVVLRRGSSARVLSGDSLQMHAMVKNLWGDSIPAYPVRWTVDAQAVATIDATGLLRALTPGRVRVTARAKDVANSATMIIRIGPADRAPLVAETRTAQAPDSVRPVVDEAAEAVSIYDAVVSLVRGIVARADTAAINEYHWKSTDADFAARHVFIVEVTTHDKVYFAVPQSPPKPEFLGDKATISAKTQLRWPQRGNRTGSRTMWLDAEVQHRGTTWVVLRFRARFVD